MGLLHPELLLLLVPALLLWWRARGHGRPTQALRLGVVLALALALATPYLAVADEGRDLVVVLDRSRSMPAGADASALELIRLAEEARARGDRVAVVSFGARAAIERLPAGEGSFTAFEREVEPDGSNVAEALETALQLVPEERQGSLLLLSDGEADGRPPLDVARRAFARGVRIDVRPFPRPPVADLSVESLDLPEEVAAGEPFQFSAWVRADLRTEAGFTLWRGERLITRGTRVFEPGMNRLLFRDVASGAGVSDYRIELEHPGDRIPENDRGLGALEVRGTRAVLVLNDDGAPDSLTEVLRRSGIPVELARPEDALLTPVGLSAYRAVVLENVAARRVGEAGLAALRDLVLERGGGLLVTGGQASFGVGGYHLTPIDEVLPVSMELRQEHRKLGIAMAIVMDRSGSMAAPASGGTKMQLAGRGAAAAIELLSAIDSVGVIAVDSAHHVIQELAPVVDPDALTRRVRSVQAGGGGIFVYTGMLAAGRMLERASQLNRHVILFSDAADSEEQEGVLDLVDRLGQMGTTVSVIALGTRSDPDAAFLEDVAAHGQGEVYFTTAAEELPRLFAQDTLTVARSSFLKQPTPVRALPDLFGLGELRLEAFPTLAGYNLNYLRPGATVGAVTTDEYAAPVLAFWHQGLGRSAAYTGQVGGEFGGELVRWEGFGGLFVTLARWLAGQEEVQDLFPSVRREGSMAVVSVEVDPAAPIPPDTSRLTARIRDPDGTYRDFVLERETEHRFEARVPIQGAGIALGTVRLGADRFVALPPIALPYSPEFERPADPAAGERLLRELARESGGELAPAAHELFRGPRAARAHRPIARELGLLALLLLLVEIAGRRLDLWRGLRLPRGAAELLARLRAALRPSAVPERRARPAKSPGAPRAPEPEPQPTPRPTSSPPPIPTAPAAGATMADALERARRSASRRTGR